jgi:hypothetical protein
MRNANQSSKPASPLTPAEQQKQLLNELSSFFEDASASDYIYHINWALADAVNYNDKSGGGSGDIVYHLGRISTLIAKLQEITQWAREEMIKGGVKEPNIFHMA